MNNFVVHFGIQYATSDDQRVNTSGDWEGGFHRFCCYSTVVHYAVMAHLVVAAVAAASSMMMMII